VEQVGVAACGEFEVQESAKLEGKSTQQPRVDVFNIGDFDTASTIFDSALDFQKAAGDPVRIRVARWAVARCLRALKRYDEAFAIQNDLIQYPEQGYVSEELGELLLVMGRPDEARLRFKKTHELLSQSLGSDPSQASRLARLKQLSQ
jgi:tetratricopeptide (TPR) repeat protein